MREHLSMSNKHGCVHLTKTEINGNDFGKFTLCRTDEYIKRVECGKVNGCEPEKK